MPPAPKEAVTKSVVSNHPSKDANQVASPIVHKAASPEPTSGLWQWQGVEAYKNDVLALYQKKLATKGVTDPETVKLLVAQIVQESGVRVDAIGDNGCSLGLIQYNTCARHKMSAKRWLEKHPEWKTAEKQLDWMVDAVVWRLQEYPLKLAIVAHNHPAAARKGQVTRYYHDVANRLPLLSL